MAHLAQINVGRLVAPEDSPVVAEFVDALEAVNAIADKAPGFVWRHQSPKGEGHLSPAGEDDALFVINLWVWESYAELHEFMYRTAHNVVDAGGRDPQRRARPGPPRAPAAPRADARGLLAAAPVRRRRSSCRPAGRLVSLMP